jgi:hypothetical protein
MNASQQIDKMIAENKDWRGKQAAALRKLIHAAAPGLTEEWKWGTPVFTQDGMVCAIGLFKDHVKVNFFKGASLKDPKKLFNAGLDAKTMRSIDLYEGDKLNEAAFKQLVKAGVEFNQK